MFLTKLMIALFLTFSCFAEKVSIAPMDLAENYIKLVSEPIQNNKDCSKKEGYDFIYLKKYLDKSQRVPWPFIFSF